MIVKRSFIIIISIVFILVLPLLLLRFSPYPELREFQARSYSIRYYDRYGMLLQIPPTSNGLRRERPEEIPESVKDVFVFSEDRRFYTHIGVDFFSLVRAMFQNVTGGRRVSGASTITMQLARLISDNARSDYNPPRQQTLGQKIIEALNAIRLESRLSKDKILEMYINSIPFGFSTEGAASAARTFFSADLSMLSPAQIFCLSVIPRRPSLYNPLDNPDVCASAASLLHAKFADNKKLSKKWPLFAQIDEKDFQFAVTSARRFKYPFETPHLIRLIDSQILNEKNAPVSEIHLSVDLALQKYLEKSIAGNVALYYSSRLNNGSALVIDNDSSEILAWVGSADFFNNETAGQIDGVLALNQPGSSMKPFLYAMALESGFNPSYVLSDVPMTFGETEIYIPQNFNNRFNGPMLFRASLASSLNIPAVYLLYRIGVRNYAQKLLSLGFDSIEKTAEDAGLGLALGNAPVSLFELVMAFSVFPRDGIYLPATWEITENKEQRTEGIEQRNRNKNSDDEERRIYSADTARLICSILSDAGARVTAFGAGRNFRTSFPSIFKTGTANQYQNIVALGATVKYTVGVWMGNFTGETVLDKTGSSVPAAIVRNTLNELHNVNPNTAKDFLIPENWRLRRICAVSGMDPASACLSVINEYVHPDEYRRTCTWHHIFNGRSETTYPAEYQAWFNASVRQGNLDYSSRPLEIVNPRDGFVYLAALNNMNEIPVEVIGGSEEILHITYNDESLAVQRPFIFFLPRKTGRNVIQVRNGDEADTVTFFVEK